MTKDEALKLALAALKYHTAQTRPIHQTDQTIARCEEALAQPAQQEPLGGTRKAFEKWAKSLPNYMDISRFEQGYSDCNTDHAWAGWQAAQPEQERNFCSRCGKRTADLTVIHTCTPPQKNT
jgi:hypothetical protein